jgi:hypothetical protein
LELGVEIEFGVEVEDLSVYKDYDLIIAADGVGTGSLRCVFSRVHIVA